VSTVSNQNQPSATAANHVSPRVLVVTAMYPTPGNPHSGTFVKGQIDSLESLGVRTDMLHLTGRSPEKYARGLPRVFRAADPSRFDLIHGHYGYCGIVARAQWRLPVVVTFHGDDLLGTPDASGRPTLTSRLAVLSSLVLARAVDGIIVQSPEMFRILPAGLRVPTEIIPCGIDFSMFRPISRSEARLRLGLDSDRKYAVFAADPAIPRKAFAIAEAAVRQLAARGTTVELLPVYGKPQAAIVDYMNAADVLVLPSMWEGSPMVIKEAMACGVPIVAADVGDVRAVIGKTAGCTVAERTPDGFARGILAALDVPGGRTTGRDDIAHLSLPAIAARVRNLYAAVLDRHSRPAGSPSK
jgi:teichuronic acid biosynthesis glycosyltransferase TuaC